MKPAKMMGGDFFDVFEVDDDRVGFVMADVSGKGVPATFFIAVARTLLRSIAMGGADLPKA
jgi:sigma-B regulation protein RsbU (phosphoserine phosphatase)